MCFTPIVMEHPIGSRPLSPSIGIDLLQSAYVLEGGPVSPERGFVLHSGDRTYDSSAQLTHHLYLSTALDVLEAIANEQGPEHYLVALGYAGWGAGQLEGEIANNVWLTAPGEKAEQIIFQTPIEERLNVAAATLGIDFRLIAGKPGHA